MMKALLVGGMLAVAPTSTNYTLQSYDFGNGGGASSSSNYTLQASAGTPGNTLTSSNFVLPAGITASETVATPAVPTFVNENNAYNQLKITLNVNGFASDTRYLIAVSDNDFVTTQYVQPDQTLGTNPGLSNYQTYAAWGGASGFQILGLQPGTAYKARVAAWQGGGTGSPFGASATAATVQPSLTFGLSTSLASSPPFNTSFSSLPAGQITTANATLTATVTTNAAHGGSLLIRGQHNGLFSSSFGFTISSASADLASAASGYGARITSVSQSNGGPLLAASPYNGTGDTVGAIGTTWLPLATFTNPVSTGAVTLQLKAKSSALAPAATDYSDQLTLTPALVF